MSNTGKQNPLGVNVLGSLLQNQGLNINPVTVGYIGTSTDNNTYVTGTVITETCLNLLTEAINQAYIIGEPSGNAQIANTTYANLITVGANVIPALGNSPPPTYEIQDPFGQWQGQVNTGYAVTGNVDQGQAATWLPYDLSNPNYSITRWGYLRLLALQGYNDFNWNGIVNTSDPNYGNIQYNDFVSSFLAAQGQLASFNETIFTLRNSTDFLDGTYSNMNDLISGDITGVSLATREFGKDLMNMGKALSLVNISTFGLPSNLLISLQQNNAITPSLALALLASDLTQTDIQQIVSPNDFAITTEQQQKIYGAFLIIQNEDLLEILDIMEVKTENLTSLADLLNVQKCFPNSYATLTVPLYTGTEGITNSKTYYLLFADQATNPQLSSPVVIEQVGTQVLPGEPSLALVSGLPALVREAIQNLPSNVSTTEVVTSYIAPSTAITGPDVADISGSAKNSLENLSRALKKF